MKIQEITSKTGLSKHAVRHYEKLGFFGEVFKPDGYYKDYPENATDLIHYIQLLQSYGFTLAEIKEFLKLFLNQDYRCKDVRKSIIGKRQQIENKLKDLTKIKKKLIELEKVCQSCPDEVACNYLEFLLEGVPSCCHVDKTLVE